MRNRHGLDVDYFRRKLLRLVRDLEQLTPSELAWICVRLSRAADAAVLAQAEYAGPAPAPDDQDLQEER
jgi:hypothetical protein